MELLPRDVVQLICLALDDVVDVFRLGICSKNLCRVCLGVDSEPMFLRIAARQFSLTAKPPGAFTWKQAVEKQLRMCWDFDDVARYEPEPTGLNGVVQSIFAAKTRRVNTAVLGPKSAGKSSFINKLFTGEFGDPPLPQRRCVIEYKKTKFHAVEGRLETLRGRDWAKIDAVIFCEISCCFVLLL